VSQVESRVRFRVDGDEIEVASGNGDVLLDVLRHKLGRYGVKEGCRSASCGACTVLRDGDAILSCLTLALDVAGCEITTVAGLRSSDGELHPLQLAFIEHHAVQCGFCTPGMLLAAKALLDTNPQPTESEVRRALSGNLCRCTGYARIVKAVLAVAEHAVARQGEEVGDDLTR
jgi:aerobic carbon-monoxide dehydrogenase small subunit